MKFTSHLMLLLLGSTLPACVVVPKKVASYDEKCRVSTQKIQLTMEQMDTFDDVDCLANSCKSELARALLISSFVATTSAIVSGSVALVGNTLHWVESQGKCPNEIQPDDNLLRTPTENVDERYLIHEEIVTAKS